MRTTLTEREARELTRRMARSIDELIPLVMQAFHGHADKALSYGNWDEYCKAELRGFSFPVGTRDERRETVVTMRKAGMSQRAIGSAIGVDHVTVINDLRSGGEISPPETVVGRDGKHYAPTCKPTVIEARAIKSPLYFARVMGELAKEIDAQHYGPDDMTAEQLRILTNLRNALEEFSVVWHDEEIASIALEEQKNG